MRRRSTAFSIARARRNAFVSRALESRLAAPPSRPMTCFQSRLTSDSWVMEPWNHKAIQPVNLYFSAYAALPGDTYSQRQERNFESFIGRHERKTRLEWRTLHATAAR